MQQLSLSQRRASLEASYRSTNPSKELPVREKLLFHFARLEDLALTLNAFYFVRHSDVIDLQRLRCSDLFVSIDICAEQIEELVRSERGSIDTNFDEAWNGFTELLRFLRGNSAKTSISVRTIALIYFSGVIFHSWLRGRAASLSTLGPTEGKLVDKLLLVAASLYKPLFHGVTSLGDEMRNLTNNLSEEVRALA